MPEHGEVIFLSRFRTQLRGDRTRGAAPTCILWNMERQGAQNQTWKTRPVREEHDPKGTGTGAGRAGSVPGPPELLPAGQRGQPKKGLQSMALINDQNLL